MADFENLANLTLEQLRAMRTDISELRSDSRDIKASLAVLRAYVADQHTRAESAEHTFGCSRNQD